MVPQPVRRRLVLAVCCLSLFMVGLDNTIVNLALPSIRHELGASVSGLQWTIDAYTLVLASLLMLAGSTADRIGRRRTFQTGLALFSLGSLLCGIAPNVGLLVAFRALQAVGGSMLNPVALSIVANVFTDPRDRTRAIGVWAAVNGLSLAVGPVLGGVLVDWAGWRSIFWINVPVGVAAIVLTALFVPESRAPHPRRPDPVGQLLVIVALASATYGIIEGRSVGTPVAAGCFAVAAAALAILVPYERRRRDPLLELRFFRSVPFSGATLTAVTGFAALSGFLFLNTLYLQETRGFSVLHAGLLTLPMAVLTAVGAPLSGRLVNARGPRLPLLVAGAGITAAGLVLAGIGPATPIWLVLIGYVCFGVGYGLLNAPITNAAVSGMPRERAGLAAAVASTSRQVGISLGVAVIGAVVAADAGTPPGTGHAVWAIVAGCGVLVFALGLVTTGRWARATAARVNGPDHDSTSVA